MLPLALFETSRFTPLQPCSFYWLLKADAMQTMRPCARAVCTHCGCNVSLLGLDGLGILRRKHERQCRRSDAQPSKRLPLLPRVDISVDVRILSSEDMARMLSLTPNELREIKRVDPELAKEVMSVAVVGWRPGIDAEATLRLAMAMGPGDGDKIMVQARAPRIPVPVVQSVQVDCLDTSFLTNKHWGGMVAGMEDFDAVAVERCEKMQLLARRLAAHAMTSRGGG